MKKSNKINWIQVESKALGSSHYNPQIKDLQKGFAKMIVQALQEYHQQLEENLSQNAPEE